MIDPSKHTSSMRRRDFLRAIGLTTALTAGCLQNGRWSDGESSTPTGTPALLPEDTTLTGWPMLGANPAHTGSVTDDPPNLSEPSRRWEHTISGRPSTPPTVGGDIVVVGLHDGTIQALERASGTLVWETKLSSRISGFPVVHDGIVYAGSDSSEFVALDARTGAEEWRYEFDRADQVHGGHAVLTPAVAGDTVMITIDGATDRVHAASVTDGSKRWSGESTDKPRNPVPYSDRVYVARTVKSLESGETIQQYSDNQGEFTLTPAVTDDAVFLVGPEKLARYPVDSDTPDWEVNVPSGKIETPVFADGTVFVSGIAFDATDGTRQFTVATDFRTVPAIAGNLGLLMRQESLVAFDPADRTVRWEEPTALMYRPKQPAIAEDGAFVSTGEGVIAFE